MAGPYLKSGESIILTTDRVLIDDAEYDLILTSHRLALVDSDHFRDQPQVIPFATILSVKGGTTPAREPFITLTVIDPAGIDDAKTLDLIFSQQPYQDRTAECDLWVKKLIELVVSIRNEPVPAGKRPAAVKSPGTDATVRRFSAPEILLPHTKVPQKSRRPSEALLSAMQAAHEKQDDIREEPSPDDTGHEISLEPESETGSPTPDSLADEEHRDLAPLSGASSYHETLQGTANNLPDAPEETLRAEPVLDRENAIPEKRTENAPDTAAPLREPEPEVQDHPAPVRPDERRAGPLTDIEALSRQIEEVVPVQIEETIAFQPGTGEPVGVPDGVVFPVLSGDIPDAAPASASPPILPVGTGRDAGPHPEKKPATMIVAMILVILVICGVSAVMFLSLPGNAHNADHSIVTPTVTPLQQTSTIAPALVPAEGVWVKVTYNGTYFGEYGNPGSLIEVRGTGEQFYPIKNSNDLVQADFQKLDSSGDNLTVEVYNNSRMVTQISKNTPRGAVALLVDPNTGKPPFVPVATINL